MSVDPNLCPHKIWTNRLVLIRGGMTPRPFCTTCGYDMESVAQGKPKTWEDYNQGIAPPSGARAPKLSGEGMKNGLPGRRFVFGSRKFWVVWREGTEHVVLFGAIGTSGQTRRKDHGSVGAANAAIEKLIGQKVGKGYVEDRGFAERETAKARDAKPAPRPHRERATNKPVPWDMVMERANQAADQRERLQRRANKPPAKPKPKKDGFLKPGRRIPKVDL